MRELNYLLIYQPLHPLLALHRANHNTFGDTSASYLHCFESPISLSEPKIHSKTLPKNIPNAICNLWKYYFM